MPMFTTVQGQQTKGVIPLSGALKGCYLLVEQPAERDTTHTLPVYYTDIGEEGLYSASHCLLDYPLQFKIGNS